MSVNIERQLQHFREELSTAAHTFFLWKGINNSAAKDDAIHRGLNEQALSWNTITHSLQTTFFVALGRLFDTDGDAFSAHAFLRSCIDNIDQFDSDAIRQRKIKTAGGNEPDWLDEYIAEVYVPVEKDFQTLRGELSKRQKQYEKVYRPIRNQVFAHKDSGAMDSVEALFGETSIDQIEELLTFLYQIQEIIQQLLHNGQLCQLGDFNFDEEELILEDIQEILARLRVEIDEFD